MLKRSFEDAKDRINLCGVAERRSERPLEQRQHWKGAPAETRAMETAEQSAVSGQSSTACTRAGTASAQYEMRKGQQQGIHESKKNGRERLGVRPLMQSGQQDVPRQRHGAATQGRKARLLDMSNEHEHLVVASVTRIVAELVRADYGKAVKK